MDFVSTCEQGSLPTIAYDIDIKAEQREEHSGNAQSDGFSFASTDLDEVVVEIALQIVCQKK